MLFTIMIFWSQNPVFAIHVCRLPLELKSKRQISLAECSTCNWGWNLRKILNAFSLRFLIGQFFRKCLLLSGKLINRNRHPTYGIYPKMVLIWGAVLGLVVMIRFDFVFWVISRSRLLDVRARGYPAFMSRGRNWLTPRTSGGHPQALTLSGELGLSPGDWGSPF